MHANPNPDEPYQPRRQPQGRRLSIRGLDYFLRHWPVSGPSRHQLLMLHGWMDVSASFQFLVDQLPDDVEVFAPDWRGYGHSSSTPSDTYWFADYLADLDALIAALESLGLLHRPLKLLGHSMGGNLACLYAGIRPRSITALINLEGVGMPATDPSQAPARYAQWLDELAKGPPMMKPYADQAAVARRLMQNNHRLRADFAAYLASHWAAQASDGQWHLLADPKHKGIHPVLYRVDEVLACWRQIEAPVLWVCSEHMNSWHDFVRTEAYQARLGSIARRQSLIIKDAGHMLHHDQPQALAQAIMAFLQ
ncbi:MAG: alpha/beta hydrolase [Betaproteobacteria bacterium]|nr:alpha/beta hydrolase [Pseudomonadota bacterium]NBO11483.1 alpha/beta hydrolase [Betaproteobacteria bacterium]NBO43943.1 alpha/beta hydrolase [Betaproteobacteria bacterium]NBP10757.1 alpha/beta hydrolase [Betaproteobacteria bacterium]NBP62216.1 alpha/beta hydrolase [Betaproteobacteria bacterium]